MPRAGKFLSRGLWEQPGPTTCISSVHLFRHWITGPLTASGSRGEGAPPGVGLCPPIKQQGSSRGRSGHCQNINPDQLQQKSLLETLPPAFFPATPSLLGGWQQSASGRRTPALGPLALGLYCPRLQSPAGWPEESSAL